MGFLQLLREFDILGRQLCCSLEITQHFFELLSFLQPLFLN